MTTTIAIATHELPHEIGDFAILMKKNFSLGTILFTQLMTATGALFGGLIGIEIFLEFRNINLFQVYMLETLQKHIYSVLPLEVSSISLLQIWFLSFFIHPKKPPSLKLLLKLDSVFSASVSLFSLLNQKALFVL